jgi:hypothetical protein
VGGCISVLLYIALVAAQAWERSGAAGQIVPIQLADEIVIFAARLYAII